MIDAAMIWNEPNNKSHWDLELDPDFRLFAETAVAGAQAIRDAHSGVPRVLGGMSPIDANFVRNMQLRGVLDNVEALAVHGFPLDWNHWSIHDWPAKVAEIRALTHLPVWVSEVGVSTFGAEEVQAWGLARTAELLKGEAPRILWYSLFDLPKSWEATTRHREAEGSSYYRHFYLGLVREDGTPKPSLEVFAQHTPDLGLCQWFHFEDHRLDDAVIWMRRLGVRHLRTGLSWADWYRPNAQAWFDRMMDALAEFDVTVTFCFTPEHLGIAPHHTSPPQRKEDFAEFCHLMMERYAARTGVVSHAPAPLRSTTAA
ncbi:beta-xylosidase [Salinarimonas ramus]|uniref:Beta-xylosidase n=1 Tax=Salinarimonas ramus TaxID=690164 RepID=A0A917Q9Q1_9HYPH|nr:beta-xylosidase [Salinarimonas ramus]GGK38089.1 beta-xylosidase [Salinarimonas ramus]